MLHFPSPSNNDNRLEDQSQITQSRYQPNLRGQASMVDNFITIRVFLKVIKDSNNEHLKKLFQHTNSNNNPQTQHLNQTESLTDHPVNYNGEDQVYIDIEIQQHLNCADLIIRAIDWFNEHLKERQAQHILEDRNLDYYFLYMAKKTGKPNDDFPNIEKSQIVSKINYHRFALCAEQAAIISSPISMTTSYNNQNLKDPKKQSIILGQTNANQDQNISNNIYQQSGELPPSSNHDDNGRKQSHPIQNENRSCQQCCLIF
ncbi:UNKNOWN [Stylonychia lemnae]|uniref:CRIM domain-containing protein n=1 Tax=Stylonychia lemnae TaxID=5949 RepID=A0A078A865_STYLE|nr:UNKNOWN [Stylonychia lemnae]|eukprot:CDW78061.1 UNKNOWN [Stylonychia lemnae]